MPISVLNAAPEVVTLRMGGDLADVRSDPTVASIRFSPPHALLAVLSGTLVTLYYGGIDYLSEPMASWDLLWYRRMAAAAPGLAGDVPRPFCYRILGPYLAGLAPLSDTLSFRLLSSLSSGLLTALLFVFLRRQGLRVRAALMTTVLFALNARILGFLVWNYFQVADLIALVCLLLLFDALYTARWPVFAATLAVGVLARESALLVLPVAFVYLWEKQSPRQAWGRLAVASIPGLVLVVVLRTMIEPSGGPDLMQALAMHAPKLGSFDTWFRLFVNSFVPIALVPLIAFRSSLRFFADRPHLPAFLALVLASTFFGADLERLMAPSFIVVYLLLGTLLDGVLECRGWCATLLIAAGAAGSLHHTIGAWNLPNRDYTVALTAAALVLGTGGAIVARVVAARARLASSGSLAD